MSAREADAPGELFGGADKILYLVSGRDDFRREEFVGQLKQLMHRLPLGEHNIVELEGGTPLVEIITICDTAPFLCEKRMVIVRGLATQLSGDRPSPRGPRGSDGPSALAELAAYLARLPESTHLVLVEEEDAVLNPLAPGHPDAVRRRFPPLAAEALIGWIHERARKHGTEITGDGANIMAELVGPDLYRMDREIQKLAASVEPGARVGVEEVRELVSGAAPAIFALHDAIAEGRLGPALAAAQRLLAAGHESAELFAQVVGLARRLLVMKELVQEGRPLSEAADFGITTSRYAQDRLRRQAARIPMARLEHAYQRLAEIDIAIKTGRLDPEVALELAIAELAGVEPVDSPGQPTRPLRGFAPWGTAVVGESDPPSPLAGGSLP